MDPYQKKLSEMKGYVPFLDKMISRLEKVKDGTKDQQLSKMKDLLKILTTPDKKLRLETLLKCEAVLQTLYEKIEGKSFNPKVSEYTNRPPKSPSDSGDKQSLNRNYQKEDSKGFSNTDERCKNVSTPTSPTEPRFSQGSRFKPGIKSSSPRLAPSAERSSSQVSKARNTGPGLLPTPGLRPSFDPSHGTRPSGNKATAGKIPSNPSPNTNKSFDRPRAPNFSSNRFDSPNVNRPVTEPWASRPPPFAPIRGSQTQPNRFPSPWLNQENAMSPWGQGGGFRPQVPPPNFMQPPPRQNFKEQNSRPWIRHPPPVLNDQRNHLENSRIECEWGQEDRRIPIEPFTRTASSNVSTVSTVETTDSINLPNTNQPPPWSRGDQTNSFNGDNRVSDNEWCNKTSNELSNSLPSVPPPPPRISDIVASTSSKNLRCGSSEPVEEILATPDSPEPHDMGIIDTPDSPDSSPLKITIPSSPSQNDSIAYRGKPKVSNEIPKVIPLERQYSKQVVEDNEGSEVSTQTKADHPSTSPRKISFTIGQGANNKSKTNVSSTSPSNQIERLYRDNDNNQTSSGDVVASIERLKPMSAIESPASPPSTTNTEYEHQSRPTNIPTIGISNVGQNSSNENSRAGFQESKPNIRNVSNANTNAGRKTLLDTPVNHPVPLRAACPPHWKPHHTVKSHESIQSPSQLDHPGSASNSPYSPYSPGQSPQQTSQHRSSSNSPSTYSPYSPNQSSQIISSSTQHQQPYQAIDRNRHMQTDLQHHLPNLPPNLSPANSSGGRGQVQNVEAPRSSQLQNIPINKNLGPQPDHRNSMLMAAQPNNQSQMPPYQNQNAKPRKAMTYGEYRKWKEEQRKREESSLQGINSIITANHSNLPEGFEQKFPSVPMNHRNTDPRKRPTVLASEQVSKRTDQEVKETVDNKETNTLHKSISSFKIPKKKKAEGPILLNQIEDKKLIIQPYEPKDTAFPINRSQGKINSIDVQEHDEKDSGSDSEPELKIAEHETGSESDHDTPLPDSRKNYSEDFKQCVALNDTNTKNLSTSLKRLESSKMLKNEESSVKQIDTKGKSSSAGGFLHSIVSSMAPKDAKKLLQKANSLENHENITLKQLKLLLADDSDQEEEIIESKDMICDNKEVQNIKETNLSKEQKSKKPRLLTKTKQSPTPGVRKSRRLMQTDTTTDESSTEQTTPEKPVVGRNVIADSDDDDDNQLVIDEETPTKDQNDKEKVQQTDISRVNVVTVDFSSAVECIEDHSNKDITLAYPTETTYDDKVKVVKKGRGRPRRTESQCEGGKQQIDTNPTQEEAKKIQIAVTTGDEKIQVTSSTYNTDSINVLPEGQENKSIKGNCSLGMLEQKQENGEEEEGKISPTCTIKMESDVKPIQPVPARKERMNKTFGRTMTDTSDCTTKTFGKKRKISTSQDEEVVEPVTIKKELKEADLKVFLVQEEIPLTEEFSKKTSMEHLVKGIVVHDNVLQSDYETLKKRVVQVKDIAERLQYCTKDVPSEPKESCHGHKKRLEINHDSDHHLTSSTTTMTKLENANLHNDEDFDLVVTEKPTFYSEGLKSVIHSLESQVSDKTILEDNRNDVESSESHMASEQLVEAALLDIVKIMTKDENEQPNAPLKDDKKTGDPDAKSALFNCKDRTFLTLGTNKIEFEKGFKNETSLAEMIKPVNLKHLFKCMVRSSCAFTSDNAAKFRMHLDEHSSSKKRDRHGWLNCAYCIKKWSSPDCLISHIIRSHGGCQYQCFHCFSRQKTQIDLILHQQDCHSDKPKKFICCKSVQPIQISNSIPTRVSYKPYKCRYNTCTYESPSSSSLSNHLYLEHKNVPSSTDYQCVHCHRMFSSSTSLILHSKSKHQTKSVLINVRHVRTRADLNFDEEEAALSSGTDDETLTDEKLQKNATDVIRDINDAKVAPNIIPVKTDCPSLVKEDVNDSDELEKGFAGLDLYRCGNRNCSFRAGNVISFKLHLTSCHFSQVGNYLTCFHCAKQLKHVPTMLEHLKSHGLKRYLCSLCTTYRSALPMNVKTHMKNEHKSSNNFKLCSLNTNPSNPEDEMFLVIPKNCVPRAKLITRGTKIMDTFSPADIDSVPHRWMTRMLLRCSNCDFSTKVRLNLIKHLRLHLRASREHNAHPDQALLLDSNEVNDDNKKQNIQCNRSNIDFNVPFITPINEPTGDEHLGKARMTNLLFEDPTLKTMTEEELKMVPKLIQENKRFVCCHPDCSYCTLDDAMLFSHIQTLHSELTSFVCPHCTSDGKTLQDCSIDFKDLQYHLKCHGELLYKCCHCQFHHWCKRTAEEHVNKNHETKSVGVRDVRKDSATRELWKKRNIDRDQKLTELEKVQPVTDSEITYRPFRCGICDNAHINEDGILKHIEAAHGVVGQFKCIFCTMTSTNKNTIDTHFKSTHADQSQNVGFNTIPLYYVDQYNVSGTSTVLQAQQSDNSEIEEKREPLWKRDMPGLKHIRGILYEEYGILDTPQPNLVTKSRQLSKKMVVTKHETHSDGLQTFALSSQDISNTKSSVKNIDEAADDFPMKCKECNFPKKTVKGLKMHIKLMHLRTGKFLCQRCEFSANILSSINTHFKIKHPDAETADFEEQKDEVKTFSQGYWKDNWLIPTLEERKNWVCDKRNNSQMSDTNISNVTEFDTESLKSASNKSVIKQIKTTAFPKGKLKRKRLRLQDFNVPESIDAIQKGGKKLKRGGIKRKLDAIGEKAKRTEDIAITKSHLLNSQANTLTTTSSNLTVALKAEEGVKADQYTKLDSSNIATEPIAIQEISHFEQSVTYKCQFCPKRTQNLERIERHIKTEHSERSALISGLAKEASEINDNSAPNFQQHQPGYKILTRDQVVDMLTLKVSALLSIDISQTSDSSQINSNLQSDYICFYCDDVVGNIYELKTHFVVEHGDNPTHDQFKVKTVKKDSNKKIVNGYLECQICGYLSGGFDRSKQRVHFHDEHPLEEAVNVSKYVLKHKNPHSNIVGNEIQNQPNTFNKFDPAKFIGMKIHCPKSIQMENDKLVRLSERCNFETQSLATMNGHLKKHTLTYKCGHCGKTHSNSSDFHRHTAMSHGNKIPDLVKDPEANAQFQALKGLVEANLEIKFNEERLNNTEMPSALTIIEENPDSVQMKKLSPEKTQTRMVARKSTGGSRKDDKSPSGEENTTNNSISSEITTEHELTCYGNTSEPIDFSTINTQMSMGGMPIILNVAKMSEIVNINPQLLVKDCMLSKKEEI